MISLGDARRLLGVAGDADADAVRAARRRLAKSIHPDLQGGDAEAMRRLNEAADVVLHELGCNGVRAGDRRRTRGSIAIATAEHRTYRSRRRARS